MRYFQIFDKINSFLKNVSSVFDSKKARLHLWRAAEFAYICWLPFFLFRFEFQKKIQTSWRNYLTWTADWCEKHNTLDTHRLIIFLSAIAVMQVIFWIEISSALFLIAGIHSTTSPKGLWTTKWLFFIAHKCTLFIWWMRTYKTF